MRGLFFLVVLFIIAVALRIDFFFTIFYLFALVYALSHIWMQSTARRLSIQRRFDGHAFCGDEVKVDLQVHNSGWLPVPWLEAHESLPVQLATPPFYRQVFSLGARAGRRLSYVLHCEQRGYYRIGPMTVRAGDLLGLVRPRLERAEPTHLIVYPRIVPLEQLGLPTRSPLVALPARSPLFEDPARVMGVRDYQRGDSPRRIHWSASAKATSVAAVSVAATDAASVRGSQGKVRLMVKRYEPAVARDTLICLDLCQEDYGQRQRHTATELAIVVAASLANHIAVREGLPVGLLTQARDPLLDSSESPGDTGPDERHPPANPDLRRMPFIRWMPFGRSAPHAEREASNRLQRERGRRRPDRPSVADTLFPREPAERPASSRAAGVVHFSLPPRSGRGHLMSLLEVLARVQVVSAAEMPPGVVMPFVDLLRRAATSLSWGATLTIISGRESQELFDALVYLRRTGFAVSLILVQPGLSSDGRSSSAGLRSGSERINVPVYHVWQPRDLESIRHTHAAPMVHRAVMLHHAVEDAPSGRQLQ